MSVARAASPGIVIATAALVLSGCAVEVPVGVLVSETGAASHHGEEVRRGIELAARRALEQAGGTSPRVRLIVRDDATSPEQGIAAARELIDHERVGVIVGAVSSAVTLAVAPLCQNRGVILVSPTASAPEISEAGDRIFRVVPSDAHEGAAMAEFARSLGLRTVVIVAVASGYGRALRDAFAGRFASGGRRVIAAHALGDDAVAGLDGAVASIVGGGPDGVYIVGGDAETEEFLRRLRASGAPSVAMGTSWVTPSALRSAGAAAEGFVFPMTAFDAASEDPATIEFVRAYRARFGVDPSAASAHGYDALGVVVDAFRRAGSADGDEVLSALAATEDYRGAAGPITFDQSGDAARDPAVFVVSAGRVVPYERFVREGGVLFERGRE